MLQRLIFIIFALNIALVKSVYIWELVESNDVSGLRTFLQRPWGERQRVTSDYYATAIKNQSLDILNVLLDHDLLFTEHSIERDGYSHFSLALQTGNTTIINRLLDYGLQPHPDLWRKAIRDQNMEQIDLFLRGRYGRRDINLIRDIVFRRKLLNAAWSMDENWGAFLNEVDRKLQKYYHDNQLDYFN